jgi:chitinase
MICQGVKAHIAIGGWGGSIYFSSNVATAENRTAFVNTVVDFVEKYDLDGINFEYVCMVAHHMNISDPLLF